MVRIVKKKRIAGAAFHHPFCFGFLVIFLYTALASAVSLAATPQVSAGYAHSVALKSDGTVWTWGDNSSLQLGLGLGAATDSPNAQQVSGISGVVGVAAGEDHTLALDSSGNVWAWGANNMNQLGDPNITNNGIPNKISGLSNIVAIAAGTQFSMALNSSGRVWAWGRNDFGQMGNGALGDGISPTGTVQVPTMITALSGIKWIAAGDYHALATDGTTVWAWGSNSNGQLGNSSITDSTSPVQVTGLSGVTNVAAGTYHSLALKSDGTVVAWGKNTAGQLGNGNNTDSSVFVPVSSLASVTGIAAGFSHSIALASNGTLQAWGDNTSGEFGNGATTGSNVPVTALSAATPAAVCSAGTFFTLALKADGTVWASGINDTGQLGNLIVDTNGISSTNATPSEVKTLSPGIVPLALSVLGDMDSDGSVTPHDALLALQYFVGTNNLKLTDSQAVARGDMDGDGSLTPHDALLILKKFVGL
jgi:alpha-tubulin suppressor-like RCC1 family protein